MCSSDLSAVPLRLPGPAKRFLLPPNPSTVGDRRVRQLTLRQRSLARRPLRALADRDCLASAPLRGGGLEPPWLLTASTSNGIEGARPKDFAALERQQTSESGQKRLILAELGQNSVHRLEEVRAAVTRALCAAAQRWDSGCEARELRVHLDRLLALLEAATP